MPSDEEILSRFDQIRNQLVTMHRAGTLPGAEMRTIHMCVSVRGMLNWSKADAKRNMKSTGMMVLATRIGMNCGVS